MAKQKPRDNAPKYKKPPLGITPRFIWDETRNMQRMNEIKDGIDRYCEENLKIPLDWIIEYNELTDRIKKQ